MHLGFPNNDSIYINIYIKLLFPIINSLCYLLFLIFTIYVILILIIYYFAIYYFVTGYFYYLFINTDNPIEIYKYITIQLSLKLFSLFSFHFFDNLPQSLGEIAH